MPFFSPFKSARRTNKTPRAQSVWEATAADPDAAKAGRFKVTVRLEFFSEAAAQAMIDWTVGVAPVDATTKRAAIFVAKPDITRTSLEWKAAQTQTAWDRGLGARRRQRRLVTTIGDNDEYEATLPPLFGSECFGG